MPTNESFAEFTSGRKAPHYSEAEGARHVPSPSTPHDHVHVQAGPITSAPPSFPSAASPRLPASALHAHHSEAA